MPPEVRDALRALAPDVSDAWHAAELARVRQGWTEPHRSYHTLMHLSEMVEALHELLAAGELPREDVAVAVLAAAYHDLAYDPRAAPGSNEHRSATLARDHLHRLGVADHHVDQVEALVLMTADHDPTAVPVSLGDPRVAASVSDADLWVLAAPAQRYAAYRRQVRAEFAHVPEAAFRTGRATILQGLLDRPRIYVTEHAVGTWEPRARHNVEAEVEALTTGRP